MPEIKRHPGKDERGYFANGNRLAVGAKGGGNPINRRRGELNRALAEAITPEDITAVIKAMIDAAVEDRDAVAAKIVLDRGLGRLEAELKIKRADADEAEVERRLAQRMRVFAMALNRSSPTSRRYRHGSPSASGRAGRYSKRQPTMMDEQTKLACQIDPALTMTYSASPP